VDAAVAGLGGGEPADTDQAARAVDGGGAVHTGVGADLPMIWTVIRCRLGGGIEGVAGGGQPVFSPATTPAATAAEPAR
jgi:hypothetical protein